MYRTISCLCCLAMGAPALAVEPSTEIDEQAVQEITDLRSELTDPEIVQATDQEFSEALRAAPQRPNEPRARDEPTDRPERPERRRPPQPSGGDWGRGWSGWEGPMSAPTVWVDPSPPAPGKAPHVPPHDPIVDMKAAVAAAPRIGPHGSPPPRPPHVLLRESAFHLDRVAHQLETAEQYREADAVRTTAQRLRESARRLASPERRGPREGRVDGRVRPRQDRPRRAREASEP